MPFEFIDNTAPVDTAARQRIRRQAALGKNLGRKLSRPSRKQAARQPHPVISHIGSIQGQQDLDEDVDLQQIMKLPRSEDQIGNTLTQLNFKKIGPDGVVMNAISFILQAPRSTEMGIGKAVHAGKVPLFSRFIFQDEAYFHGAMALSLRSLSSRPEAGAQLATLSIQHMSRSLQLINSRLGTDDSVADINIAVVVVMTQYTRMSGQLDECRIHLDGLQKMVQMKGGINAMRPDLAEKIFRADLGCAYHLSAPTKFTLAEVEEFAADTIGPEGVLSKSERVLTSTLVHSELLQCLSPTHYDTLLDATRLAHVLDAAYSGTREWLSVRTLHQATLYIGYRLVGSPPQPSPNGNNDIDMLVRLGLVAFCLTFFRSFDNKIITASPLGLAIAKFTQTLHYRGRWSEELVLWTLLIGNVIQIFGEDMWPAIMHRAKASVDSLKVTSWDEMTKLLRKFPWSDALFGTNGKIMWDMLMLLPSSPQVAEAQFEVPLR